MGRKQVSGTASRRGQTMVEYVIVTAALLGVVAAALALATAARRAAGHSTAIVASPYP